MMPVRGDFKLVGFRGQVGGPYTGNALVHPHPGRFYTGASVTEQSVAGATGTLFVAQCGTPSGRGPDSAKLLKLQWGQVGHVLCKCSHLFQCDFFLSL